METTTLLDPGYAGKGVEVRLTDLVATTLTDTCAVSKVNVNLTISTPAPDAPATGTMALPPPPLMTLTVKRPLAWDRS